jgi:hypothetical protein
MDISMYDLPIPQQVARDAAAPLMERLRTLITRYDRGILTVQELAEGVDREASFLCLLAAWTDEINEKHLARFAGSPT